MRLLVWLVGCEPVAEEPCVPVEVHVDRDLDGFGGEETETSCLVRDGWVASFGDCDDLNGRIHPGTAELCNGRDDDCDGDIDDGLVSVWYLDRDADGAGDPASVIETCQPPIAAVAEGNDCDDLHPWTAPDAPERCDGADNDCDGYVDEDVADPPSWYPDADLDGHGALGSEPAVGCEAPPGTVGVADDCDDVDPDVAPDRPERCNTVDDDCDGLVDDDDLDDLPIDAPIWYVDDDGDTFGDVESPTRTCTAPPGTADRGGDCDDGSVLLNPDAAEICEDGIDQDCNTHDPTCHAPLIGDVTGLGWDGVGANDAAGTAVAGLGDVDGDGFDDVGVGGPGYDGDAGAAWLVRGPVDVGGSLADVDGLVGTAGFHEVGAAVAGAGDVDGDGLADLIIGAPRYGPTAPTATGAAYVVTGPVTSLDLGLAFARLDGTTIGDEAGAAVLGPGDLDGDGLPDLVVGAPGADRPGLTDSGVAAVVLGPVSSGSLLFADTLILGEDPGGRAGDRLGPAGDTDGDGVVELWVGAPASSRVWNVPFTTGFVFLADATDRVVGVVGDGLGASIAGGEDLDSDGYDDLVVGAPGAGAGAAYVLAGPVVGEESAATAVGVVEGVLPGDRAGTAVAVQEGALVVGVPGAGGAAWFGWTPAGVRSIADADAWFVAGPEGGASVSGAGDVDDDGALDWVIGAPASSGSAIWVFGY